ncbi:MAG: ACP S-malonyltransferase [Pyrinomonadaceae bacterium]
MSKTAYIFPGQGSQFSGMGRELYEEYPEAKAAFEEADSALESPISEMCFSGTEEELALTENTQPAILTVSIAAYRAFVAAGAPTADFVAGHSLGEYSAVVAAEGMTLASAAATVRKRGLYMQQAVPVGTGAMAAILGSSPDTVVECCNAAGGVCAPANINSPKQIVIAGEKASVEKACELLSEAGAKRTVMLNVSAPFHCDLMKPAQDRLSKDLEGIDFADLNIPLMENVSAELNSVGERVRQALIDQVSSPVRWLESVENLISEGVDTFVEIGPGKVLSGLVRQINRDVRCFNVSDRESIANTLENI